MKNSKEISRKEFLKVIPTIVVRNMRSIFHGGTETFKTGSVVAKAGVARLDEEYCLAWGAGSCQACYLACHLRDKAIILDDQKPYVNVSFCDGCAQCVTACQAVNDRPAIRIISNEAP